MIKAHESKSLLLLLTLLAIIARVSAGGNPCFRTPNPCRHGICEPMGYSGQNYCCHCHPGWTGSSCDQPKHPCVPNPCEHGGCCSTKDKKGYRCECDLGWGGDNCDGPCDPHCAGGCAASGPGLCDCDCDEGFSLLDMVCVATCPSGFTYMPSAESCYKVIYERDNWYSAGWKCQDLVQGSHLAYISSATENTVVKTFLASELSKNAGNTTVCISSDFDFSMHGEWFWTSGQRMDRNNCTSPFVWKPWSDIKLSFDQFTNWVSGQPDCWQNMEACVNIWPKFDFGWNDAPCNTSICSLCEYNL